MEHNFNPNKGDYKYILEEQRRKENGEASLPSVPAKQKTIKQFWKWLTVRFRKRSKNTNKLGISFPLLMQLFS